jgi:hypothetical protein
VQSKASPDPAKLKRLEQEKDQEITRLNELLDKFDVNKLKTKLSTNLAKTLEDLEVKAASHSTKESEIMAFMDKMIQDHEVKVKAKPQDVYLLSLDLYKRHLQDLEARDIS